MTLHYKITREQYIEVIEYQMRLDINQTPKIIWYAVSNLLFCGFALYFCFARTGYAWYLRALPLLMAAILLALSTYKRTGLSKKAARSLDRFLKEGQLDPDFLGEHTLTVQGGKLKLSAGKIFREVPCSEFGKLIPLKSSCLVIAGGVILDLIPLEVFDSDASLRQSFLEAVGQGAEAESQSGKEAVPDGARDLISWKVDEAEYTRGLIEGRRGYYFTKLPYNTSQLMSLLILGYGLFVLGTRANLYIGIAFLLIGIVLNRRLFTVFSPLGIVMARRQVQAAKGLCSDCGTEQIYFVENYIHAEVLGQHQSTRLKDIRGMKKRGGFLFLYSATGQMYEIPLHVFADAAAMNFFCQHFTC